MVREALCLSIQKVAMPLKSIRNAIRPNTRGWVEIFVLNASQADSDSFVVRRFREGEGVSGGERAGGRAAISYLGGPVPLIVRRTAGVKDALRDSLQRESGGRERESGSERGRS